MNELVLAGLLGGISKNHKNHIREFVSSDENLLKVAKAEGFGVFNPEEDN